MCELQIEPWSKYFLQNAFVTRMHSSRMRILPGVVSGGGVSKGYLPRGVSEEGGVCLGVYVQGVYTHQTQRQTPPPAYPIVCWDAQPLPIACCDTHTPSPPFPVNRMTGRCKNITLPQTSFTGGKYVKLFHGSNRMSKMYCLLLSK